MFHEFLFQGFVKLKMNLKIMYMRNSSLNKKVLHFWLLFGSTLSNKNDNFVFTDLLVEVKHISLLISRRLD